MAASQRKSRLDSAYNFLKNDQPAEALPLLKDQLKIDRDFNNNYSDVKLGIARCYVGLEMLDEAIQLLGSIKCTRDSERREKYHTLSRAYADNYRKTKDNRFLQWSIQALQK